MPLLPYLNDITRHGAGLGCYIPPVHSLCESHCHGVWFNELLEYIQNESRMTVAQKLAECLCDKKTGLMSVDMYANILHTCTDGYEGFFDLAVLANHPALCDGTHVPTLPRQ